jgi:SAM-dependent methyltransferase
MRHLRHAPAEPARGSGVIWDQHARMYAKMAAMEAEYTEYQVGAFPCAPTDTVLDVGCGPGRITVPMARRAASVTAMDSSEKMLDECRANCARAGVDNVRTVQTDWHDVVSGENLERHDIVVCSRTAGLDDVEKLSSFARKRVAMIVWANAPSIPPILDRLFAGAQEARLGRPGGGAGQRMLAYNVSFNLVYDLGYEPNVAIVPDGFTRTFASAEEQYDYLRDLRQMLPGPQAEAAFRGNVDHFTTTNPDGSRTFRVETRSVVVWWDVRRPFYDDIWNV